MSSNGLAGNNFAKERLAPLQWAEKACETLMLKYPPEELPPVGRFHYHQGVFLSGMEQCWRETRHEKYYEYIKAWVDSIIFPDGSIHDYNPDELDDIQPGILLFNLYERTGDERYFKALSTLVALLRTWKRNSAGGFWHKTRHPNQMWLDSLFMGGPIAVRFGRQFQDDFYCDVAVEQALLIAEHTRDEKTGLFYHGWDDSKEAVWADPETGRAPEFWGRAIGWYPAALLDMLEYLPENHKDKGELVAILKNLLFALVKYQDPASGLWYQVVDKGDQPDNWLETSCSCLFIYSIARAIRLGYLGDDLSRYARHGYQGVIDRLKFNEKGGLIIGDICIGTGIGDYAHYIARPRSENDLHGAGAFILMCVEMNQARGF